MMVTEEELYGPDYSGEKDFDIQKLAAVFEWQVSYFTFDEDSLYGLATCLENNDNPWKDVLREIVGRIGPENPRRPLTHWKADWMDEDLRDLLVKMMNLNPMQRITAKQALEHRWWKDVPDN